MVQSLAKKAKKNTSADVDQRLTMAQKNSNDKQWYRTNADKLDKMHGRYSYSNEYNNGLANFDRMKVNYDLFNNILDLKNFEYVCKPFGAESGELPASMVNRDISSGKIRAILGMEMKRPFIWEAVAVNPEATSRREQESLKRIKDFVIDSIMMPIKQQIAMQHEQEMKGRELTEEEQQQVQQQIEEEIKSQTPQEVKRYMEREYQDPAEVMSNQLLEYLEKKNDIPRKFLDAFKHGLISGVQVMYIGILNGEPVTWVVNPLRFSPDMSPDNQFIEDGETASCEYRMTRSEIVKYFGDELTEDEIDRIYKTMPVGSTDNSDYFSILQGHNTDRNTIGVLHCTWKSLREIGFLTYIDEMGQMQEEIVDEHYKINRDAGDIEIEWKWIPEVYETWKIKLSDPIYIKMQPVPGQFKDLNDLYYCKLPYYGVVYDNMNSEVTSMMDRLKVYQYYYNIVMYKLELLLASDKGKKVLMNIGAVPESMGIDIEKWQQLFESTPFMWYNPAEEGNTYNDANTVAKVVDMSLISDIKKYMEIAEYLRVQCGRSVGMPDQIEGQVSQREAVGNVNSVMEQSATILESYFDLHAHMKRNVLQGLLETAKIAYRDEPEKKLAYVLDDMSIHTLTVDMGILDNNTLGIFVSNAYKITETKEILKNLTQAALQNQKVELSDVISVLREESIVEAQEKLKISEANRREYEQQAQQQQLQAQAEEADKQREHEVQMFENQKELTIIKEEERRKTELAKTALLGQSFNPDQDADQDGTNDYFEIARDGMDADIKRQKIGIEQQKLSHTMKMDKIKVKQEEQKIKIAEKKAESDRIKARMRSKSK